MTKPRLLLSVTNDNNDFQIEQVKGARLAATRMGADLDVVYAQDDGIIQSQQLLDRIQPRPKRVPPWSCLSRPDPLLILTWHAPQPPKA